MLDTHTPSAPQLRGERFLEEQRRHPLFRAAEADKAGWIQDLFRAKGVPYPPPGIFLRVFKQERLVELWVLDAPEGTFQLLKIYPITALSGGPGPKRRDDDGQIPEGFYHIDRFHPTGSFRLSLGISYPNRSDLILGDKTAIGGEILIHGGFVTLGCIPISDDHIRALYIIAAVAHAQGQEKIPVHIFPGRLDAAGLFALQKDARDAASLVPFWKNLMIGYNLFETTRRVPRVSIASDGSYLLASAKHS